MPKTAPATTVQRRYASPNEAGEYTHTSDDTIRRMIRRGELRQYRIGRQIRVDLNELDLVMARAAGRVLD